MRRLGGTPIPAGARALPVLGWQGLVSGYFTKSERTSAHPGSGRRGDGPAGRPEGTNRVRPNGATDIRPERPVLQPEWAAWIRTVAVRAELRQRVRELSGVREEEDTDRLVDCRCSTRRRHRCRCGGCHSRGDWRRHRHGGQSGRATIAGRLPCREHRQPPSPKPTRRMDEFTAVRCPTRCSAPWGAPQR